MTRLETAAHCIRPSVFRFDYRRGIHAPEVPDSDALAAVPDGSDALVVRFYSDGVLRDRRLPAVEGYWGDPVSPAVEPYAVCEAYRTERCGSVKGQAYVIPCRSTGRKDARGRRVYEDARGAFVLDGFGGCAEHCCRFWLASPAVQED